MGFYLNDVDEEDDDKYIVGIICFEEASIRGSLLILQKRINVCNANPLENAFFYFYFFLLHQLVIYNLKIIYVYFQSYDYYYCWLEYY